MVHLSTPLFLFVIFFNDIIYVLDRFEVNAMKRIFANIRHEE